MTAQQLSVSEIEQVNTGLRELETEIKALETDQESWRAKLQGDNTELQRLRDDYDAACRALADGQKADPVGVQERMRTVLARIEGRQQIVGEKETALAQLRAETSGLYRRRSQLEEQVRVAEEMEWLRHKESELGFTLAEYERLRELFDRQIVELRSHTYRNETNKKTAFDVAYRFQARWFGMRV